MMEKLKTLINIEQDNWNTRDSGGNVIAVFVKPLRQEAIKWIKELNDAEYLTLSNGLPDTDENSIVFKNTDKNALILWIKHFFNIQKEELNK